MPILFAAFVALPIIEIWILLQVGGAIGALPTIAVVIGTGFVGAWLARREGLRTMQAFAAASNRGELPGKAMFDGLAIFAGGALLLTPGIVTDVFGFCLLMPPTRAVIRTAVMHWVKNKIASGDVVFQSAFAGAVPQAGPAPQQPVARDLDPSKVVDARFDEPT